MKYISKTNIAALFLSTSLVFTSCESIQNANNTQKGTAIGTAAGGVLGGILGNNIGHGGNSELGVILGAVIGGVAGGLIGNKMDKQAKEIKQILPGAEVERVNEGIKITLPEKMVNFDFNKSDLTAFSKSNLDKLAEVLVKNPDTNINVYGYTDSKGSDEYNQKLSERRANSVITYLVTKGIAQTRLFAMGMGEKDPVGDNATDEGRAQNRRVEFAITANEEMIKDAQEGK